MGSKHPEKSSAATTPLEQDNPWVEVNEGPSQEYDAPTPSAQTHAAPPASAQSPDPSLPRYSGSNPPLPPRNTSAFPYQWKALATLDYSRYRLPDSTFEDVDKHLLLIRQPQIGASPQAMAKMLREQASLPPKPTLRILGWHKNPSGGGEIIDFDLRINLQSLIIHPEGQKWNYIKTTPTPGKAGDGQDDGRSVEEWVKRFANDRSDLKQITLERRIVNFDQDYLEGQVRTLVASTKYQGKLAVAFPIAFGKVGVRVGKEPVFSWKKLLGSIGNPQAPDKTDSAVRYDVIQSIWPFANAPPETLEGRECVVQNEQSFWNTWKVPIRNAILNGMKGYVTTENWIDAAMGELVPPPANPWPRVVSGG